MGKKGERVGDSGEERGEWGIVGKKGRELGDSGENCQYHLFWIDVFFDEVLDLL